MIEVLIAANWVILLVVYRRATARDRRVPIDDIGVFYLAILVVYSTLPPILWLVQGGEYTSVLSGRLQRLQPTSEDVLHVLGVATCYAAGFALAYVWWGANVPPPRAAWLPPIDQGILRAAVSVVLLHLLVGISLSATGVIGGVGSYIETYQVISELPLGLRQFLKISNGASIFATGVVVLAALQRWPQERWLLYVCVLSVVLSFSPEGSRTGLAIGVLQLIVGWHVLRRNISGHHLAVLSVIGFGVFLLLGLWRELPVWGEFASLEFADFSLGEFDSIWANALELLRERQFGSLSVPWYARIEEFVSFVPAQALPFPKLTLAEWFVDEFHPLYRERGGGLAFGAICQVIIGWGWMEAVFRGGVMAGLCIFLVSWVRSANRAWWKLPCYIYLFVFSYQAVRNTAFSMFGPTIQVLLPSVVVITGLARLLVRNTARQES